MRRCLMSVILLLTMLILNGCAERNNNLQKNNDEYQKVRLVMTANGTEIGIESLTANRFAKLVEEASGGNVHI